MYPLGNDLIMTNNFFTTTFALVVYFFFMGCNDDDSSSNTNTLSGQWSIVAISNSSPTGPVIGPVDGEVISITFVQNGEFSGSTSINSFGGRFSTNDDTLLINELVTTEALDTFFGQAFYQAMVDSSTQNQNASEFEIVRINESSFNLVYDNFKFLTLERM